MAVEILERDLGVPVQAMEGSDIAYDIHVRRVFLRTGLATRDDLGHMVEVARKLYPLRPGKLDYVAWRVGRTWCHAGVPACVGCVLKDACPKAIDKGAGVRAA
jgi:endonuclease III